MFVKITKFVRSSFIDRPTLFCLNLTEGTKQNKAVLRRDACRGATKSRNAKEHHIDIIVVCGAVINYIQANTKAVASYVVTGAHFRTTIFTEYLFKYLVTFTDL